MIRIGFKFFLIFDTQAASLAFFWCNFIMILMSIKCKAIKTKQKVI